MAIGEPVRAVACRTISASRMAELPSCPIPTTGRMPMSSTSHTKLLCTLKRMTLRRTCDARRTGLSANTVVQWENTCRHIAYFDARLQLDRCYLLLLIAPLFRLLVRFASMLWRRMGLCVEWLITDGVNCGSAVRTVWTHSYPMRFRWLIRTATLCTACP